MSPHSKRVPGSNPGLGLSVWSLHVSPSVCVGLLLLPPKNMHVRLICVSKLTLGVSVSVRGPMMDWRPVPTTC